MHTVKKIFKALTGYWLHKQKFLPIGLSLEFDIHERIKYEKIYTVFDVGANVGQSYKAFRQMFPASKIYCFEPIQTSFEKLKQKVNNDRDCVIENFAFGSRHEVIEVKLFDHESPVNSLKTELMNKDDNAVKQKVLVRRIDDYCLDQNIAQIDLLKIDTEGYEILVLQGSESMLKNGRIGMIFCEVGFMEKDIRHIKFVDIINYLSGFGFSFFGLYDLSIDSFHFGDYYGNALFVHSSKIKSVNESKANQ